MPHLEYTRLIDAPQPAIWDVITDHELYGDVAPNLTSVEVVDGAEETMVRRCVDTGGYAWTEACTTWEDGQRFGVEVDVANSEFHRHLFNHMEGTWGLEATPDGYEVFIRFDYDTKYGPFGRLISAYLSYKAPAIVGAIFDSWEAEIDARREPIQSDQQRRQPSHRGSQPNARYP
ncbi:MAG: SRPBCC family protein [Halobacteriales archaeon]|nr:SRPBCC family protein [Halobacteriales archaeon]